MALLTMHLAREAGMVVVHLLGIRVAPTHHTVDGSAHLGGEHGSDALGGRRQGWWWYT